MYEDFAAVLFTTPKQNQNRKLATTKVPISVGFLNKLWYIHAPRTSTVKGFSGC